MIALRKRDGKLWRVTAVTPMIAVDESGETLGLLRIFELGDGEVGTTELADGLLRLFPVSPPLFDFFTLLPSERLEYLIHSGRSPEVFSEGDYRALKAQEEELYARET